jgi:hypothetical protein
MRAALLALSAWCCSALQYHSENARRAHTGCRAAGDESGGGGGQFGGRKGCCYKADNWLNSMSAEAPPETDAPPLATAANTNRARELTAGGAPRADNLWHRDWAHLLDESLRKCSGTALLPAPKASASHCASLAASSDLVVVSHDDSDDPVFNYATKAALELWEMEWDAFTATPSRLSAEPVERDERERLLRRVAADGFVDDYAGVRVSSKGTRFEIRDAYVWNVYEDDAYVGQAALFRRSDVTFL